MNRKLDKSLKIVSYSLLYVVLFVFVLLSAFLLAGVFSKYLYNKSNKNYVKKIEYKKAKIFDSKLKAVEELNKLESKLSKMSNEKKIAKTQRKIETLNKHIENYNIALNTELPQPKVDEKLLEKVETKINDIKENVL